MLEGAAGSANAPGLRGERSPARPGLLRINGKPENITLDFPGVLNGK